VHKHRDATLLAGGGEGLVGVSQAGGVGGQRPGARVGGEELDHLGADPFGIGKGAAGESAGDEDVGADGGVRTRWLLRSPARTQK
jgi:hypothetical protein